MDTQITTYVPCSYCGGITGCNCPIPSAPMERSLYKTLQELRPSEKSSLALSLSHWLCEIEDLKVKCWCGMTVPPDRLHYPGNDPEDGPAHKPSEGCPNCGQEPHTQNPTDADCYPTCSCSDPSPRTYDDRDLDHPNDIITLCAACGLQVEED